MNLTPGQRSVVAAALEAGLKHSAEQLGRISKTPWEADSAVLSDGPSRRFRALLGGTIQPHYGAYLPMQDKSPLAILVLFPAKTAGELAAAFTKGYGTWVAGVQDLESKALAEISNILAHALAGELADSLGASMILASPQMSRGQRLSLLDAALDRFPKDDCFLVLSQLKLAAGGAAAEVCLAVLAENAFLTGLLAAAGRA